METKKIFRYIFFFLLLGGLTSCDRLNDWYFEKITEEENSKERRLLANQKRERAAQEKKELNTYGTSYNEHRERLGVKPIPVVNVDTITSGKFAHSAYLKWKNIIPRKKNKPYWSYKKIYYDNQKRLIEEDFFYGKKVYKIFNEVKLDIYADNCIELNNCDNPPTIMVNEKLLAIYCHTDSSWQIKYTTVNHENPVTDFEGREKTTLLSQSEMNQLLTSWGLDY